MRLTKLNNDIINNGLIKKKHIEKIFHIDSQYILSTKTFSHDWNIHAEEINKIVYLIVEHNNKNALIKNICQNQQVKKDIIFI
jgi:protein involved in ribonucleotide reduction